MSDMKATSLGPCGSCSKPINQMTPTGHVFRGIPKRAYLAHKECADKENEPLPEDAVVVAVPTAEAQPSMPVKEQSGVRRGRGRPPGSKNKPR